VVIALLEWIRNFLAVDGCMFVLALNPHVVNQGIKTKYNNLDVDGRECLEKILNYPFYVPEAGEKDLEEFARQSLTRLLAE
jgi:hypothetical protein